MGGRKKKDPKGEVFSSIRKPTAPSSKKFGPEQKPAKLDPVGRRSKHKKNHKTDADI